MIPTADAEDCFDQDKHCREWAASKKCAANPSYMLEHCRKSCAVCDKQRSNGKKQANCYGVDQIVPEKGPKRLQQVEDYMLRKVFVEKDFKDVKLEASRETYSFKTSWLSPQPLFSFGSARTDTNLVQIGHFLGNATLIQRT